MSRKLLMTVAALIFLCGLLLQMPAALVIRPGGTAPGLHFVGPQGSLQAGQLSAVLYNGRTVATQLQWRFSPLWLLLGQRVFRVEGMLDGVRVASRIRVTPLGTLHLRDLQGRLSIAALLGLSGGLYLPMSGYLDLDLEGAKISGGRLQTLTGSGQIRGLTWTLANPALAIGDFDAQAVTEDGAITIRLSSPSGAVDATGELRLSPDGRYQLDLRYRARPQADAVLRNLIAAGAAVDAQGWAHYRKQGQL